MGAVCTYVLFEQRRKQARAASVCGEVWFFCDLAEHIQDWLVTTDPKHLSNQLTESRDMRSLGYAIMQRCTAVLREHETRSCAL